MSSAIVLSTMSIDLFTEDLGRLGNEELFAAIADFAQAQPVEGWRHDYTQMWDDSSLKTVAGFAHTFGGLLIVGVKKEKRDLACQLIGVESKTEYKTRIASSIASNISPVPSYDIFECYKPADPVRRFCVVRVRESRFLHLITKKDFQPVYVRNEDESPPADAVQLRRLVDRERAVPDIAGRISERANQLRDSMVIGSGYASDDFDKWQLSAHQISQTFLKLMLVTQETQPIELEKAHEDRLRRLIGELYPRIPDCINEGVALRGQRRRMDFYEYSFFHKKVNYEIKWLVTNLGDVGFATQMDAGDKDWSVVDVAHYVVLLIKLALRWWEFVGYFGESKLYVQLNLPGLSLFKGSEGYFIQRFSPTRGRVQPRDIRKDAIVLGTNPGNAASTEIRLNSFSGVNDLSTLTTSILNKLLTITGPRCRPEPLTKQHRPYCERMIR